MKRINGTTREQPLTWMALFMLAIGLFILIIAAGGCSTGGSSASAGNTLSQNRQPAQIVELASFLKEFDANKATALGKYKGHNIQASGYIDKICAEGSTGCQQSYVLVKPEPDKVVDGHKTFYMGSTIQCFLGKSQAASFSPGKAITVSGPVDDYVMTMKMGDAVMGMVMIKNCEVR